MMQWRRIGIALGLVTILLGSTIWYLREPAPPPSEGVGGSSDWLNSGDAEDLSAFLVPRDRTDFDWKNMSEGPTWRIGDVWTYDGRLDATAVIDDAEVEGAAINDLLTGTATMEVENLSWMEWNGVTSLTYTVRLSGVFEGLATFPVPLLETYTDNLVVTYDATEYVRMSDFAIHRNVESLRIDFEHPFGVEGIADIIITTDYTPELEWWDFPLGLNETWLASSREVKHYEGSSGYVALPEQDEVRDLEWRFVAIEEGVGADEHPDCNNSRNVTAFNLDNQAEGWRWYCPEVGVWSWRVGEVPLGVTGDFRLLTYTPASSRIGNPELSVELAQQGTNKSVVVGAYVNSSLSGVSLGGLQGELIYGSMEPIPFTTDSNGSAWVEFDSGNRLDPSATFDDLASHGVIALVNGTDQAGLASLTIYGSSLGAQVRDAGAERIWVPHEIGVHNAAAISAVIRW